MELQLNQQHLMKLMDDLKDHKYPFGFKLRIRDISGGNYYVILTRSQVKYLSDSTDLRMRYGGEISQG